MFSMQHQIRNGSASVDNSVDGIEASPAETPEKQTTSWSTAVHSLLDQPPATFPQHLMAWGIVFCIVFGSWAWFGKIEEIGKAKGKLVPQGEPYKVHPVELGKVTKLAVEEGETVKAGEVLFELDTELAKKEVERLEQLLSSHQDHLAQQQTSLERLQLEAQTRAAIAAAEVLAQRLAVTQAQNQITTNRQLLFQLRLERNAYQEKQARLQPITTIDQERIAQLKTEIAAHQERLQKLKLLEEEGAISQEFVFQGEQALRDTEQRLMQTKLQNLTSTEEQIFQAEQSLREVKSRISQSEGNLATALKEAEKLQAGLDQKQAEATRNKLETQQQINQLEMEITNLNAKIAETQNLLVSAGTRLKQRFLKAPVDGMILSMNLENVGEVVQAGQTIAEIAPQGAPLVLSALLPNREAGFVEEGMTVKVKLDAYPFQDYGIVSGTVISISSNTKVDQQLGAAYRVKVKLDRDHVSEDGERIKFKPGQTATADIVIRRRRIIDVLFDPFRQLHKDGINL
jgi:HlyD family secretion protein